MTLEQLIAKYEAQREELKDDNFVYLAASSAHGDMVTRIFSDGKQSDGSQIGNYNASDPLYINPIDAPQSVTTAGKNGNTTFKNGKAHKTAYFPSYRDFRSQQGREAGFVNLQLFGNLQSEFAASLRRQSQGVWESEIRRDSNLQKALGNQKRFGVIFAATNEERETYRIALNFELSKILR